MSITSVDMFTWKNNLNLLTYIEVLGEHKGESFGILASILGLSWQCPEREYGPMLPNISVFFPITVATKYRPEEIGGVKIEINLEIGGDQIYGEVLIGGCGKPVGIWDERAQRIVTSISEKNCTLWLCQREIKFWTEVV